jgi:hypothetical protein
VNYDWCVAVYLLYSRYITLTVCNNGWNVAVYLLILHYLTVSHVNFDGNASVYLLYYTGVQLFIYIYIIHCVICREVSSKGRNSTVMLIPAIFLTTF